MRPTSCKLIPRFDNEREYLGTPTDLQLAVCEVEYNKGMRRPKDFARAHFSAGAPKWGRELRRSFCPSNPILLSALCGFDEEAWLAVDNSLY